MEIPKNNDHILKMITFVGRKLNQVHSELPGSLGHKIDRVLCSMAYYCQCQMTDADLIECRDTLTDIAYDMAGIGFKVKFVNYCRELIGVQ